MSAHHKRFLRCQRGVAYIEWAFAMPALLIILLGVIEFWRYTLIHQKLDKAATALADYVTQGASVSKTNLNVFTAAGSQLLEPFDSNGATVIFSSVVFLNSPQPPCGDTAPCVSWQYTGAGSQTSQIGSTGGVAALPGDYVLDKGQNAIVAEIYFPYRTLYSAILSLDPPTVKIRQNTTSRPSSGGEIIYKIAVFKPRQGTLTVLKE